MPSHWRWMPGARLAEPGEFTLRAYLNGRIDLPQAEAVRDLIDSTTLYQARIAAQQAGGSVSRRIAPLKEQLLELIALLEAGIDFAEDDVSVAAAGRDPAAAAIRFRSRRVHWRAASLLGASCARASRWPLSAGPMSGRAACSTACWSRTAPSSRIFPAPRAIWCPKWPRSTAFR